MGSVVYMDPVQQAFAHKSLVDCSWAVESVQMVGTEERNCFYTYWMLCWVQNAGFGFVKYIVCILVVVQLRCALQNAELMEFI